MPHILLPRIHNSVEIQWEDAVPESELPDNYVRLGGLHGEPPVLSGPVKYRMHGGALNRGGTLPDILAGRWSSDMIVSSRVREIFDAHDRVSHHYIPLELELKDGRRVKSHFLFVAGDRIDGIDAQKSEVTPKIFGGKLGYYSVPARPVICWKSDAIKGRAIWVDRYLPRFFGISDELKSIFEHEKITRFSLLPSSVSG